MKSKKQMVDFLTEHFRYDTAGSWNQSTSYAVKMKIWDFATLRARVKLVKEFDALAKSLQDEFLYFCREFKVEEETIMVPKKVKRLTEAKS